MKMSSSDNNNNNQGENDSPNATPGLNTPPPPHARPSAHTYTPIIWDCPQQSSHPIQWRWRQVAERRGGIGHIPTSFHVSHHVTPRSIALARRNRRVPVAPMHVLGSHSLQSHSQQGELPCPYRDNDQDKVRFPSSQECSILGSSSLCPGTETHPSGS